MSGSDPEALAIRGIDRIFKTLEDAESITRVLNYSVSKHGLYYDVEQRVFVSKKAAVVAQQNGGGVVQQNTVIPNQVGVHQGVPQGQNIQGQHLS